MRRALAILFLLLVSCDRRIPELSEEVLREIHAESPGMTEACLDKLRWGGVAALPETDQCYRMDPIKRWRGFWASGFEVSRFCPEPATTCSDDLEGRDIWLSFGKDVSAPRDSSREIPGVYVLEFDGRITPDAGHFGHLGCCDYEIIVDRLISAKRITPK